jgi:hypothetical protein
MLIVEDGTGLATAESYCSVAYADQRQGDRGNTDWVGLNTNDKEAALRRSFDWLIQHYRGQWKGYRLHRDQAGDWPRFAVFADGYPVLANSVPVAIMNAQSDLATRAAAGDINPDIEPQIIRQQVGQIVTEWDKAADPQTIYPAIIQMLRPYLGAGAGMMKVIRT